MNEESVAVTSRGWVEQLLLLGTLDGAVHAVDRHTGTVRWSCKHIGGQLVRVHSNPKTVFIPEPIYSGSLYAYIPGDIVQVKLM